MTDRDLIVEAIRQRREGMTIYDIGRRIGASKERVSKWCKGLPATRRCATRADEYQAPPRFKPDPRDLTGRIAGDPWPGRSALDQRQAHD